MVADALGINSSTPRNIVARYVREGRVKEIPCGCPNNVRVDGKMRECLNNIINENCLRTLKEITKSFDNVYQENLQFTTGRSRELLMECSGV